MKALNKPTRLQILRHKVTGKKYFSKSTKSDERIESYYGSGTYWLDHISKHGKDIERLWLSDWYYDESITKFALRFSRLNKIVESDEWANLIPENGIDGATREMALHASKIAAEKARGKKRPEHSKFMKEANNKRRDDLRKCNTPYGEFRGINEVIERTPAKDYKTVESYLDGKILTKQMIGSHLRFSKDDPLFTYEDVGKNTNEIGWFWSK